MNTQGSISPEDWQKVKELHEQQAKQGLCPHCGRCPTCGQPYQHWNYPYNPMPMPTYPPQVWYVTSSTSTVHPKLS